MQARLRLTSRLLFLSSCRMTVLTGSIAAVLVAVQIGPLGGQSWAQAVFPVDAEENRRSLQDHVLHPVWNRRLQVLLVHQANYQHRLRQADHQQGHAHHKVHAWDTGETTPGSPQEAVRAVKGFRQEPDSHLSAGFLWRWRAACRRRWWGRPNIPAAGWSWRKPSRRCPAASRSQRCPSPLRRCLAAAGLPCRITAAAESPPGNTRMLRCFFMTESEMWSKRTWNFISA